MRLYGTFKGVWKRSNKVVNSFLSFLGNKICTEKAQCYKTRVMNQQLSCIYLVSTHTIYQNIFIISGRFWIFIGFLSVTESLKQRGFV